MPMTVTQVLSSPLSFMSREELSYVAAYCEMEQRKIGLWHPDMDKWERRQRDAEAELSKRGK